VFDPFYSRKRAGTGLGLTIAQRIVAAHGGRIELDSTPGQGTRVTIALPLAPVAP
jgi:two-component system sensor histidine kinase HydH